MLVPLLLLTKPTRWGRYIYFDGNSLGLQPKSAAGAIQDVMGDWAMQEATSAFEPGGVGYGGVETRRHPQQEQCAQLAVAMAGAARATEICWMNVRLIYLCHPSGR